MMFTLQDVQNEFKQVEKIFRKEVPEYKTSVVGDKDGYKELLKAYMDIDYTAFEVLYDEAENEYEEKPQDFHFDNDNSRINWNSIMEQLQELK